MEQRKRLKTKIIIGIVCVVPFMMLLSGCAAKKVYKKPLVQMHKKIALNPKDVLEIKYIRRNVQTRAYEVLVLTPSEAHVERFGGKTFKPKQIALEEGTFGELATKAVSLSWDVAPVRVRNAILEEELVLKTKVKEERVLFGENMSADFKDLYSRIIKIRQNILKKKR